MNEPRPLFNASARVFLTAFALGAFAAPAAWAQGTTEVNDGDAHWGLGTGLGFEQKPYREFDDKIQGLPLILYENKYVSILGPRFDLKLPLAGPMSFRLRARYADDGYEADDSPYLLGMGKRKSSFWLGGAATWHNDYVDLSAELLADGSGNSKGTLFKLQLDRRFTSGAFGFTPRASAQWLDRKYVDYYYGVRDTEARIDRARYEGKSTVNVEVGLRVDYSINPKQNVFVDFSTTGLGSGIKDSPLVDRSTSSAVRAGYIYRF